MRLLVSGVGSEPVSSPSGWTRATEPLISSTKAYEPQNTVQEPTVIYDGSTWKMWYTGGYTTPSMSYATCTGDPTVSGNWTKYASNPVLGQGTVVSGWVSGINVAKFGSTYYAYYYDASGGGNLKVSTSSDGVTWGTPSTALAKGVVAWMPGGWANSFVWGSSGAWGMLVEGSTTGAGGQPWAIVYATSTNTTPDSGWTVQGTGPLSSLSIPGYTTGYSGPWVANGGAAINGLYYVWYHGDQGNDSDIFHARSTDFQNWTISQNIDLIHNGSTYEFQQSADPSVLEVNGISYMFFDGVNNSGPSGYINVATYPGTLASYVASHP